MSTQEAIVCAAVVLGIAGIVIAGLATGHPEVLVLLIIGLLVFFA